MRRAAQPALPPAGPDDGHGAVVHAALVAHAPVDVVVHAHPVAGPFALVLVAEATAAGRDAAAVVVTDEIVLAVLGIETSADPGHRRRFGAGRAARDGTAAAGAQMAVERAVTPVLAALIVERIVFAVVDRTVLGPRRAIERQHRQDEGRADQQPAHAQQGAAARGLLGHLPRAALEEIVKPFHGSCLLRGIHAFCRYSWIDSTPSSLAVNRLSSCSRELIRPLARTLPCSSSRTA